MVFTDYSSSVDPVYGTPFGIRRGNVSLVQPVQFDSNKKKEYQVVRVILSPEIPNVYSYGSFNNTQIRITNNAGISWSIVQFPNGIYTTSMIQDSITNAFLQAGWISISSSPPVIVSYNPATRLIYSMINSANLAVGTQAGIDFGYSQFYNMLGYSTPANAIFIIDGTYSAQLPPNLDTQGTTVVITCSLIQGSRYSNGQFSNIVCRIPLVTTTSQIEICWPSAATGLLSPIIECSTSNAVMNYTVDFTTESGQSMVWLYGEVIFELDIHDVI